MAKTFLLDTNVYLTEASSLISFGANNIAIPSIVLDEIDKHKHRQDTAGHNARHMNRLLDGLRSKGSLSVGVSLGRGKGKVFAAHYDPRYMPVGMDGGDSDNKIIATALKLKLEGHDITVYSRDINMRVKCDSFGITCFDYQPQKIIQSVDKLFDGMEEMLVDAETIDKFYESEDIFLVKEGNKLHPNQYVMLKDKNPSSKKSAMARFISYEKPVTKVRKYKNIWGFNARNKEQQYAMDLLFDKGVQIVSLTRPCRNWENFIGHRMRARTGDERNHQSRGL